MNIDNITFRTYNEADLPALHEIYSYYIANTTVTYAISPITPEQMREIVEPVSPRYKTFVILYDGEICGYALFTRFKPREAFDISAEVTIYLKQGFGGKGIGGIALELLENEAKLANLHVLVALVASTNLNSHKLFLKNGYTKCADFKEVAKKFNQIIDLVCFQKIIDQESR